jgi:hypothetical protein
MGPAELLLEATFTDMRNGGDGDLSQAYKFAKKVRCDSFEHMSGDFLSYLPIFVREFLGSVVERSRRTTVSGQLDINDLSRCTWSTN